MFTSHALRAVRCPLVAIAVLSVLVAACSASAGSSSGAAGTTALSPASTAAPTPPVERFTGSDDAFYAIPDPLAAGPPGSLLRVKEIATTDGATTVKVMYLSRDATDKNR